MTNGKQTFNRKNMGKNGKTKTRRRRRNPLKIQHWGGRFPAANTWTPGSIMPSRKRVTLKYVNSNGVVASAVHRGDKFALNGCVNINYGQSGLEDHKPQGWKEMLAFYDVYKVYQTQVEVTVVCTTENAGWKFGLYPLAAHGTTDTYSPSNFTEVCEKKGFKWLMGATNSGPRTLRFRTRISDMFGLTNAQYKAEANFSAGTGFNPDAVSGAFSCFLQLYFANADDATSTAFQYQITILYDTEFSQSNYITRTPS